MVAYGILNVAFLFICKRIFMDIKPEDYIHHRPMLLIISRWVALSLFVSLKLGMPSEESQ
jgi:hypothetical protein